MTDRWVLATSAGTLIIASRQDFVQASESRGATADAPGPTPSTTIRATNSTGRGLVCVCGLGLWHSSVLTTEISHHPPRRRRGRRLTAPRAAGRACRPREPRWS
jgi:hypothetical protein